MTSTDGIPGDHGNHGLGHHSDKALQIKDVEAGNFVLAYITTLATYSLITAGAERLVACASQNCHANRLVIAYIVECVDHLDHGLWAKGIAKLRAIDGDFGDALTFGVLIDDVGVVFDFFPCNRHNIVL